MKYKVLPRVKEFKPVVIEITLESPEQVLRLKNAVGREPASEGFYELFTRLGEIYQEVK